MEHDHETVEDLKLDVRQVLAEIGAEEAVAQLEARLGELEQELERRDHRDEEHERARRGELDVMRARVSDALQVVQDAVEEQREAWEHLEQRLAQLATDTEASATGAVDALREELSPRVQRALLQSQEVEARVAGELESTSGELRSRIEQTREQIDDVRRQVEEGQAALSGQVREDAERRAAEVTELASRTQAQVADVSSTVQQQHGELVQRLEALRRELDATAGELRAGWNLRAQELESSLSQVNDSLAEAIDQQGADAAELERRWIEGTRDIARRIEEVAAHASSQVADARVSREELERGLRARLDELASAVSGVEDALGASETKRVTETEQLRRNLQETTGRLEVLQQKVANAVGTIASELTNKVSTVTSELAALRDTSVRQEQRLTVLDAVVKRLDEAEARQQTLEQRLEANDSQPRLKELERAMSSLRHDLSTLAGGVEAGVEQTTSLREQLTTIQETLREHVGLRQEVRELAARMAESSTRLDETEKLARAAGQAIAEALRKARRARPSQPLPSAEPGQPSVAAAEQAPLFQERPAVPRRGDAGRPIIEVVDGDRGAAPPEATDPRNAEDRAEP